MDLSEGPTRRNMLKSSIGNTKESHLVVLDDFKRQEDYTANYRIMMISKVMIWGKKTVYVRLIWGFMLVSIIRHGELLNIICPR